MQIYGLQKLTLLDFPGYVACTVFFAGCDMRCPFCHNSELAMNRTKAVMDDNDLLDFLKKRKGIIEGVVFSGGEPLLEPCLADILGKVKELDLKVKLDTNGNHPRELKSLIDMGLADYIAMDVKSSLDDYGAAVGLKAFNTDKIKESIDIILSCGIEHEFRTTVVSELHNEKTIEDIARMIKGCQRYFLQSFKESEAVPVKDLHSCTKAEMERFAAVAGKYIANVEIRGI